ncbi:MAG: hypothetical protein ACC726_12865 [Chloroflexota bacterium]
MVDVGAPAAHRVAAGLAVPLRGRAEDARPFLGDADEHDALASLALGSVEIGPGHVLLALALLEVDQRDVLGLGEPLDLPHEPRRALAEDGVAGDPLAGSGSLQEAGQPLGRLEPGHVAVEIEPVDALVTQGDVLVEQGVDVGHGGPPRWRSDRPLSTFHILTTRVDKGMRPSRRQPAQASLAIVPS